MSRADAEYPRRWKALLKEDAPPILYGCGQATILDTGGLAVVGSRHVDDALIAYTRGHRTACQPERVAPLFRAVRAALTRPPCAARWKLVVRVVGVLADSLERAAMNRAHRNFLMDGQLVLVSPYDPVAGFNVGHAMQRNKLISRAGGCGACSQCGLREGRYVGRVRSSNWEAAVRTCLCPLAWPNRQGAGGPPT